MRSGQHIVFVCSLLQDVNIIRPLAYLAARETEARIAFLIAPRFAYRDGDYLWRREISRIAADVGADIYPADDLAQASAVLAGKHGVLVAASESTVLGHVEAHEILRAAPASFLRVTLQHGYECVGFLHNRKHDEIYGTSVGFAADVVCGWSPADRLTGLAPSERGKLLVTGPTARLQGPQPGSTPRLGMGLVCENLHSVRLTGAPQASFTEMFRTFVERRPGGVQPVALRPHPAGQYVIKNEVPLPDGAVLANEPIYRTPLPGYDFCISAPSSVVIDALLAEIPVAVWRDPEGVVDARNYAGLTEIRRVEDWWAFAARARSEPETYLQGQQAFLQTTGMLLDRPAIYDRFARLFASGRDASARPIRIDDAGINVRRALIFANAHLPTLEFALMHPLSRTAPEVEHRVMTERDLRANEPVEAGARAWRDWLRGEIRAYAPDVIVCCRYSGPLPEAITEVAQELGVPLICHLDDDLLNVPRELGAAKHAMHNDPRRLRTVDHLLRHSDLIYCSTRELKQRLRNLGYRTPAYPGRISGYGEVSRPAARGPVRRVGYMGTDHAQDFEIVLPALVTYLRRHPEVTFELFGSIPPPPELAEFGDRIVVVPPIWGYDAFREGFAARSWDIGIAPLAATRFNRMRSDLKWIEYTSVGAAVIASRDMVYDEVCAEGRGLLCGPDDWLAALEGLTTHPEERYRIARRAQDHLEDAFTLAKLRGQLDEVFALAGRLVQARMDAAPAARGVLADAATPLLDRVERAGARA